MTDQKTLAQFNLYGDPSITPVEIAAVLPIAAKYAAGRSKRRQTLRAIGAALGKMQPEVRKTAQPEHVSSSLRDLATQMNLKPVDHFSFRVLHTAETGKPATTAFHVCVGIPQSPETKKGRRIRKFAILEAKEVDGALFVTEAHSK